VLLPTDIIVIAWSDTLDKFNPFERFRKLSRKIKLYLVDSLVTGWLVIRIYYQIIFNFLLVIDRSWGKSLNQQDNRALPPPFGLIEAQLGSSLRRCELIRTLKEWYADQFAPNTAPILNRQRDCLGLIERPG
jgi:hypothetical protein